MNNNRPRIQLSKLKILALALLFLAGLSGCYDLPVPAGERDQATFDLGALGNWERQAKPDVRPASMKIEALDSNRYLVYYTEPGLPTRIFEAQVNYIFDLNFISLQAEGYDHYSIFSYELEEDSSGQLNIMKLRMMGVQHPRFQSRNEFYDFLSQQDDIGRLFERESIFYRQTSIGATQATVADWELGKRLHFSGNQGAN